MLQSLFREGLQLKAWNRPGRLKCAPRNRQQKDTSREALIRSSKHNPSTSSSRLYNLRSSSSLSFFGTSKNAPSSTIDCNKSTRACNILTCVFWSFLVTSGAFHALCTERIWMLCINHPSWNSEILIIHKQMGKLNSLLKSPTLLPEPKTLMQADYLHCPVPISPSHTCDVLMIIIQQQKRNYALAISSNICCLPSRKSSVTVYTSKTVKIQTRCLPAL